MKIVLVLFIVLVLPSPLLTDRVWKKSCSRSRTRENENDKENENGSIERRGGGGALAALIRAHRVIVRNTTSAAIAQPASPSAIGIAVPL